ncbi:MAG: hypothetical protein ACI9CE_000328 [Flavobacterium sp.]
MNKRFLLEQYLQNLGPIAIAVSGGVDSMTLAVIANRVNAETHMFHAISPAVPSQATDRVKRYAISEKWNLNVLDAGEIRNSEYLSNPVNRCYFCKTHLYEALGSRTDFQLLSGTNLDDLGDYRPGLIAASQNNVLHPYVEVNISKAELRSFAKELNLLDLHDLPAAPCLSSRIETGIAINADLLPLINQAEQLIWEKIESSFALTGVRCRQRQGGLVIELESKSHIDTQAKYAKDCIKIASEVFSDFNHLTNNIKVEPYKRGSAFLIEAIELG